MEFKTDVLLHGGDYNPDQWLDRPDILERDAEMLAESGGRSWLRLSKQRSWPTRRNPTSCPG